MRTEVLSRLARLEYLLDELVTAVREHGEYIQDIERRNGYNGGWPEGIHSDKLDLVGDISLEIFENEEADERTEVEE